MSFVKRRRIISGIIGFGILALPQTLLIAMVAEQEPQAAEFQLFGESLIDLHRASSHFPMGLLMSSVLFDALAILLRREDFRTTAFWTLMFGVAGAAGTLFLGLVGNPFLDEMGLLGSLSKPYDNELVAKAVQHQWAGIVAFITFSLLAIWRTLRRERFGRFEGFAYSALSLTGLAAVGLTGYLGGHLMD